MNWHHGRGQALCMRHHEPTERLVDLHCCPECATRVWTYLESRPERGSPEQVAEARVAWERIRAMWAAMPAPVVDDRTERVEELLELLRADATITAEALAIFQGGPAPERAP